MTDIHEDYIKALIEARASENHPDDEPDENIAVREAELHELVSAHYELDRLLTLITDELQFRVRTERQLEAGTNMERNYAERLFE